MSTDSDSHIPGWVADWSLVLAIVVILVAFVNYGMSFLYPSPEYEDFCGQDQYALQAPQQITSKASCQAEGGKWNPYESPRKLSPQRADVAATSSVTGSCERDYYCRAEYEATRDIHDRNGLIAMLIIGLIVSMFGFMRRKRDVIATSLAISGIIVIIFGLLRFWTSANDWAQFILLGSVLVAFIYLAVRKDVSE
jgi:hypothetical protein